MHPQLQGISGVPGSTQWITCVPTHIPFCLHCRKVSSCSEFAVQQDSHFVLLQKYFRTGDPAEARIAWVGKTKTLNGSLDMMLSEVFFLLPLSSQTYAFNLLSIQCYADTDLVNILRPEGQDSIFADYYQQTEIQLCL